MSYKINYGKATSFELAKNKGKRHNNFVRFSCIAMILLICAYILIGNFNRLEDLLIPGDAQITKTAFSALTDDIKSGRNFVDAFAVFCQNIIINA